MTILPKTFFIFLILAAFAAGFLFVKAEEDLETKCKAISESENACQQIGLDATGCRALLEKCSAYYDEQSAKISEDITKTESEKKTLNSKISGLKKKIQNLEYEIKKGNVMVKDLNMQIVDTQVSIDDTTKKIYTSEDQITEILREVGREDDKSSMEILLEGSLSDFFNNLVYLEGLNSKIGDILESTRSLKTYLEGQKQKMDGEVDQLQKTIALQTAQKQENNQTKKTQEYYLTLTEQQYQEQLQQKSDIDKKSAAIKAKLFQLVGVAQAPTFGEALEIAKSVAAIVNIRPAFLLAIISQESAIGKNVGQCVLTNDATGEGKRIKTGAVLAKVMKPTRDVQPFLSITQALGRDPHNTPVSCPLQVGWGGAMGPAQFIASTWALIKDRLNSLLGKPSDPWAIKDSFTAASLYLTDLGAGAKTASAEKKAASKYYGGSSSYANSVYRRATCIQTFIDSGTMTVDCENLIF